MNYFDHITEFLSAIGLLPVEHIDDITEVCNYVEALRYALAEPDAPKGLPLSLRLLREMHRRLIVVRLVKLNIVKELTGKKRGRKFAYTRYLKVLAQVTELTTAR